MIGKNCLKFSKKLEKSVDFWYNYRIFREKMKNLENFKFCFSEEDGRFVFQSPEKGSFWKKVNIRKKKEKMWKKEKKEKIEVGVSSKKKAVKENKEVKKKVNWPERLLLAAKVFSEESLSSEELEGIELSKEDFESSNIEKEKKKATEILRQAPKTEILKFVWANPEAAFAMFFEKQGENTWKVNFRRVNKYLLGLGHFKSFTKEFPYARIKESSEDKGMVGQRGVKPKGNRPGYFDENEIYQVIYTGYIVEGLAELPKKEPVTEEQKKQDEAERKSEWEFGELQDYDTFVVQRSEERRVGKECRSRWSPYH